MTNFKYAGVIPASKSMMNRALICASYDSSIKLLGDSICDDVTKMKEAFNSIGKVSEYDCGAAGTVFRFLTLRLSRVPGTHILKGTERLLSRPQEDLEDILRQMNVRVEKTSTSFILHSKGWNPKNNEVTINRSVSSQFASGVLLNTWNLPFDFKINWVGEVVSEGYWQMTTEVVKDFGLDFKENEHGVTIFKNSKPKISEYRIESDISSIFAVAAFAVLNGEAQFLEFPKKSLQPDIEFIEILKAMGVRVEQTENTLKVFKCEHLKPIHWNLKNCPDLFPVLSVLCAFSNGESILDGAPHLIHKESNRIGKSAELINYLGIETNTLSDGMKICANPKTQENLHKVKNNLKEFDTDHDHRLAFSAALIKSKGFNIKILHPEVVDKSFPEFWDVIKLDPK